jgi:hypothetical protein
MGVGDVANTDVLCSSGLMMSRFETDTLLHIETTTIKINEHDNQIQK